MRNTFDYLEEQFIGILQINLQITTTSHCFLNLTKFSNILALFITELYLPVQPHLQAYKSITHSSAFMSSHGNLVKMFLIPRSTDYIKLSLKIIPKRLKGSLGNDLPVDKSQRTVTHQFLLMTSSHLVPFTSFYKGFLVFLFTMQIFQFFSSQIFVTQ